jgi:DNA-binding FadR family transcriptional regulator
MAARSVRNEAAAVRPGANPHAERGQRLAALILDRSRQTGLRAGGRLPTERQLSLDLGVTRSSVRHALAILEAQGLISREVGRGTFLRDIPAATAAGRRDDDATFPAGPQPPGTFPGRTESPGAFPAGTQSPAAFRAGTESPASFPGRTESPGAFPARTEPPSTFSAGSQSPAAFPAGTQSRGTSPAGTPSHGTLPAGTQPHGPQPGWAGAAVLPGPEDHPAVALPGAEGHPAGLAGAGFHPAADFAPADVMTIRRLLEPPAMSLVVAWATAADLEEMQRCLAGGDRAASFEEFETWDLALHRCIIAASHSPLLVALYRAIEEARHGQVWGDLKRRSASAERRSQYQADHRAIVDALRVRDSSLAVEAMRLHLARVQEHLNVTDPAAGVMWR